MRSFLLPAVAASITLAAASPARAFPPAVSTSGPLTIEIAPLAPIAIGAQPREVEVTITLRNSDAQPVDGQLRIGLTDGWKVTRNAAPSFEIPGHGTQSVAVGVTPAADSYAALYPVHATARFTMHGLEGGPLDNPERSVHTVLIASTTRSAGAPSVAAPTVRAEPRGATPLDAIRLAQARWVLYSAPGTVRERAPGIGGEDAASGAFLSHETPGRPDARPSLAMHPPWRMGAGEVMADLRVQLPDVPKLALAFATAIRDSHGTEPLSDGVQFRVFVDAGSGFEPLFDRFSDSKAWQDARVDLSKFRGKSVTLRLQSGPGPARNTSVDLSYWGAPMILAGDAPAPESEASRQKRRARALNMARAARSGKAAPWSWTLRSAALGAASTWSASGVAGAAVVPGPSGLRDAFVAFSATDAKGARELVYEGFDLAIETADGRRALGRKAGELAPSSLASTWSGAGTKREATLNHVLSVGGRQVTLRGRIWDEGGALRFAWSLPGSVPDKRGVPRIARIALGAASSPVRRVYAGFGNVMQDPGAWSLSDGGFRLSTRHAGADYKNGLSLVQASDIFPDSLDVDGPRGLASLAVHHGATLSLIPATNGAFAGARVWRSLSGFKAAGGVAKLLGRVGLDQWGGDYSRAASDLKQAAAYGLTDSVFVKHAWQRWGYDFRLPDIYPPMGDNAAFLSMVRAAKQGGMLFCPHDNYIDFYPDADGFSYQHILFNADGTPQLAWLNKGPGAQSYRWSPNAFQPWLERNLKLVKAGFAPTSYFVDVFTAIAPMDFYDRSGRFFPKAVTQQKWGAAFDRIRQVLGDNAPTISEAGADSLIGHLDGGQSDHVAWARPGSPEGTNQGSFMRWVYEAADGERVPWHDMVSHGKFVLFAGGLGERYASGSDGALHGYGSDDYLSMTALGGRSPMSDGPFSRRAVMTYWLLHDICARLARSEMVAHQFAGESIHRQIVTWADAKTLAPTGFVHVNRGESEWRVGDKDAPQQIPQYGFVARVGSGAGELRADISRRSGVISAFAHDAGRKILFADARPEKTAEANLQARVLGAEGIGGGQFRVRYEWQVLGPVPTRYVPFVHFTSGKGEGEGIVFQGGMDFSQVDLARPGTYVAEGVATLPEGAEWQEFGVRFGLYDPKGGDRYAIASPSEGGRVLGGTIAVYGGRVSYRPPASPGRSEVLARLNTRGKMLDFGPIATNGALRLSYAASTWTLTPLPNSSGFMVRLDLAKLGAPGKRIAKFTATGEGGAQAPLEIWFRKGVATVTVPARTRSVTLNLR